MTWCIIDPDHGVATHHERCQACFNRLRRTDPAYQVSEQNRRYVAAYGLTRDEVHNLKARTHFRCSLCGIPEEQTPRGLVVDHEHESGRVRGALCDRCNLGVAHFTEDPRLLAAAIDYLYRATEPRAA